MMKLMILPAAAIAAVTVNPVLTRRPELVKIGLRSKMKIP